MKVTSCPKSCINTVRKNFITSKYLYLHFKNNYTLNDIETHSDVVLEFMMNDIIIHILCNSKRFLLPREGLETCKMLVCYLGMWF